MLEVVAKKNAAIQNCDIKIGGQDLHRNAADCINKFDTDDSGCKTLQNILQSGTLTSKFLMQSTAFLHS